MVTFRFSTLNLKVLHQVHVFFLVDQKALTLYSKHPIYNECTLSFESPSYDEVSCLVLFRFLLLIYVFFYPYEEKTYRIAYR